MLTKEEYKRYQKQIILEDIGINGQIKIKQSKIAVVGAGGLGCPILQSLTAMGIGTLGVIDFDTVDVSNLHRQILYSENDIGKSKVEVAIKRLSDQNPMSKLIAHPILLNEQNAESIFSDYDMIIDGCDNFLTRYIVNDACVKLKKPLIYGSILGFEGQIGVFNYQGSRNLRDLFPDPPNPEDVPSCSENGVLGSVTAIIGSMIAQETIQVVLDKPQLVNSYLIYDCLNHTGLKLSY